MEGVRTWSRPALVAGAVALAGGLGGAALAGGLERVLSAWLAAFVFWTGIALGCLALALLHVLTGGGWGVPIRRTLEAAATTLPWLALAFVPLALGASRVWHWADPQVVAGDAVLQHKSPYRGIL